MQTTSHDIIIVGGGMVGLALANMLTRQTSLSIAVIEAGSHSPSWSATHHHHRVSAIAISSQRIFQALKIWDDIQQQRISPFRQIMVWDAAAQGEILFNSNEIAEPLLGYIIENNLIQMVLENKIKDYPHVERIAPVKLTHLIEHENGIELIADDGRVFKTKLAVAADGASSWLRTQAHIDIDKLDYQQQAIVAAVHTALPHHETARQVFLESGPLAFLPLAQENLSSIVWSVPVDEATRLMSLEEQDFQHELASAFEYRLGDVVKVEKRYVFPLARQQAKTYVKSRIALVGDAAHTIHPLAGQGVNMGLLDAASLADVIVEAIKTNRDFSGYSNLRRYERWRKADNVTMMLGVDIIKSLFASEKKSIQNMRSLGLNATNRIKWIKNCFARHAVGDRDGLPSLSRPV